MIRKELNEISMIIEKLVNILCVLLTFVMFAAVFLQILGRYVTSNSVAWTEETARFCMIWLAFLGASTLVREWDNTPVMFLQDKLPVKIRKQVQMAIMIIMLVFMGCIFCLAVTQLPKYSLNEKSPALMISMLIPKASIIFGSFLTVVQLLWKIADTALSEREKMDG